MPTACTHQDQIHDVEPRTPDGCEECLKTGDRWVHLRLCLTCGSVGCCDSSPNTHATKHFHATQHPIVQSFEPNEDWSWCYVDQVILEPGVVDAARRAGAATATGKPAQASVAGPGGLISRALDSPHRSNYVIGVIDNRNAAVQAVDALRSDGFAPEDVVLQSGTEISERLEREDIGNLVRQAKSQEASLCREFDALSRGGAVLSVHTRTAEDVEQVPRIMAEHGAHSMKYVGEDTISDVPAGGRTSR